MAHQNDGTITFGRFSPGIGRPEPTESVCIDPFELVQVESALGPTITQPRVKLRIRHRHRNNKAGESLAVVLLWGRCGTCNYASGRRGSGRHILHGQ